MDMYPCRSTCFKNCLKSWFCSANCDSVYFQCFFCRSTHNWLLDCFSLVALDFGYISRAMTVPSSQQTSPAPDSMVLPVQCIIYLWSSLWSLRSSLFNILFIDGLPYMSYAQVTLHWSPQSLPLIIDFHTLSDAYGMTSAAYGITAAAYVISSATNTSPTLP